MGDQQLLGEIGQISRTVKDIVAATDWYTNILGLQHLYTFGDLAFFNCSTIRLMLTQAATGAGTESIIYFKVDDIQRTHDILRARGATFLEAPHLIHRHPDGTEEWMASFEDNEGRPLAIMAVVRT